jgi:hypothetical protein
MSWFDIQPNGDGTIASATEAALGLQKDRNLFGSHLSEEQR